MEVEEVACNIDERIGCPIRVCDLLAEFCYFNQEGYAHVGNTDIQLAVNSVRIPKLSPGTRSSIINAVIDEMSAALRQRVTHPITEDPSVCHNVTAPAAD
ncbi:hypothetical protein TREES_T100021407 [Tupaia chinensis]|uniref:Uncharacterized protein n=1 Tax=Tupaia chinensis TaxID=246437 RepID=L9L4S9_TUPCH|nr:hypothetical protein TREES_T100021407 [Tupaia chinensis]